MNAESKSRITNVEATVVLKLSKATWQKRAVFVYALTFLSLFLSRKKVRMLELKED
jgi:hypothetical protein